MKITAVIAITLGTLGAGCSDAPCVDGTCADPSNTVAYPGPCRGAGGGGGGQHSNMTFTYDAAGRVSTIQRDYQSGDEGGTVTADWSWNDDGTPAQIVVDGGSSALTWSFADASSVTVVDGPPGDTTPPSSIYDRDTFAFMPMPGGSAVLPSAELGKLHGDFTDYTWTTDGSKRIRHADTDLESVRTFDLDTLGRVVSITDQDTPGGAIFWSETFTFEDERLIQHAVEVHIPAEAHYQQDYDYDAGGNLIEMRDEHGFHEVYSYDCWLP